MLPPEGSAWRAPGFPRKGWSCIGIVDLNPDEKPADEVEYATCEACGHYPVRFVHTLAHKEHPDELDTGCICAEHLTDDYVNPRRVEVVLRKRAMARSRWLKRRWRVSYKGAHWLKVQGHHMAVFRNRFGPGWRCSFDGKFGRLIHPTKEAAMMALFNKFAHASGQYR